MTGKLAALTLVIVLLVAVHRWRMGRFMQHLGWRRKLGFVWPLRQRNSVVAVSEARSKLSTKGMVK